MNAVDFLGICARLKYGDTVSIRFLPATSFGAISKANNSVGELLVLTAKTTKSYFKFVPSEHEAAAIHVHYSGNWSYLPERCLTLLIGSDFKLSAADIQDFAVRAAPGIDSVHVVENAV